MYAARGPARPQAGHGAAHNRTRTPSHGVTLPRRPDHRRAVTRVKDACGAGQAGRAEARSLTRASRAHEQAAARERDTRGQFTMPRKPLCRRETAGRTPLDTGPLLQGGTFTRLFPPVLVALRAQSRLRREGRARILSGPSPELSPGWTLAPSARMPTAISPACTISLGIGQIAAGNTADQATRGTWSSRGDRSSPWLIARRSCGVGAFTAPEGSGVDTRTLHPHAGSRKESPYSLHTISIAIPPAWR